LARGTEALCDDVTCSAVSCTNTDKLHDRLYAPFAPTHVAPRPLAAAIESAVE
jgi:hypothetical protein